MATTVTSTEQVLDKNLGLGDVRPAGSNGGSGGNGHRDGDSRRRSAPAKYRIGMWVALAGVAMMFTALTSAYIVRSSTSNDWRPLAPPRWLWLSTALLVVSSVTFEIARRALKRGERGKYTQWLTATVVFGLGFLGAQVLAWRELVAQGIYLSGNPHSAFFYVLTGAHAIHLLGGILALDYLLIRAWREKRDSGSIARRVAVVDAAALYWHFMDGLWIYLFLLLFLWR